MFGQPYFPILDLDELSFIPILLKSVMRYEITFYNLPALEKQES